MWPTSPWSIKGVDPEAREAAKVAARRAKVPLGQWLSAAIRHAAAEQLRTSRDRREDRGLAAGLEENGVEVSPDNGASPPALTTADILKSIHKLSARVEENEQRTAAALKPVLEEVRELSDQVKAVKQGTSIESGPLERAIARLAQRLDQIEAPASRKRMERREGFLARLFSD